MQLRYQYRVYPTPGERLSLKRTFGCKRVVWNAAHLLPGRTYGRVS